MSKDYTHLKTLAQTLVAKYGRSVDLLRESRVESNTNEPWAGTEISDDEVTVTAVFVPLIGQQVVMETMAEFGGATARSKNCFLIGNVSSYDIRTFQKVKDNNKIWRITNVNVIQPGDTVLLYEIEVDG